MPKAPKSTKIKTCTSSTEVSMIVDAPQVTNEVGEPPAKRMKGMDIEAEVAAGPVWEIIEKPPLHTEWTDVPDWSGREDCPLMDRLPVEVLDKIFCVRPELQLVDYLALAGTCRFFRDKMTDDFWEDLAAAECKRYRGSENCFQASYMYNSNVPMPKAHPRAGINPFNRSIADWKTLHPETVLDTSSNPLVNKLRTVSKWASEVAQSQDSLDKLLSRRQYTAGHYVPSGPYLTGHYVPPGPRSQWCQAQYGVYKDEQASWRENRNEYRLKGLAGFLAKRLAQLDAGHNWAHFPTRLEGPGDRVLEESSDDGIDDVPEAGDRDNSDMSVSTTTTSDVEETEQITQKLSTSPFKTGHIVPDPQGRDQWETPISESSEQFDEFDWLSDRGAKLVPSPRRSRISERVNGICITKSSNAPIPCRHVGTLNSKATLAVMDTTMEHPAINLCIENTQLNLWHTRSEVDMKRTNDTYALFNQEVAENPLKHDEIDDAIAAGTISHTWKPRPRRITFECCKDDNSMCYCKRCWEGQCECGDYGKDLTRV